MHPRYKQAKEKGKYREETPLGMLSMGSAMDAKGSRATYPRQDKASSGVRRKRHEQGDSIRASSEQTPTGQTPTGQNSSRAEVIDTDAAGQTATRQAIMYADNRWAASNRADMQSQARSALPDH